MKARRAAERAIQKQSVTVELLRIAFFLAKNINNILHFQSKLVQVY